ncbi:GntR family transcriptional regulator [Sinosporangium siamense]|uniref:HTH gntR-type domain-containing protein n=1 Tax=Sinosporangium siamense TaxID=1367973 RepID=A0A919RJD0_9ACTN|nr:winged helix-turn-helix domain-containing protein [Sinosporangium siamense]GII94930.1 hypothetical protein Ssi02_51610 [Sinosporangium siamense]
MSTPKDRRRPYLRIADEIRQAIAAGQYAQGEQLPSARELSERHGVAMMTIGNALGVLREEGLIETRHGTGSFVIGQPESAPERPTGADEPSPEFQVLSQQLDAISENIRRLSSRMDELEALVLPDQSER